MPRAMWKGSLSFGLVNLPVSLNLAVRPKDIHFHLFHDADQGRIREKRVCEKDGAEVPYEHVVKGYEVSKHQLVVVTPDELRAVDPVADRTIGIEQFVELKEVDPLLFERSYYLSPEGRGSQKAYAVLCSALKKTGKAALGRIVLSTVQHLCLVWQKEGQLLLTTLAFADELVEAPQAVNDSAPEKELKMAQLLIDQMSGPFELKKYRDNHRERVLELLERKASGANIEVPRTEEPAPVTDLAAALQRSLEAQRRAPKPARARRRNSAPKKTRRAK